MRGPYLHQLDGLRAFAVLAVAWHHWAPASLHAHLPWQAGVQLFFVLSGFLITGILLDCRRRAAGAPGSGRYALGSFYARRVLRILPLYYGVLIGATLLDFSAIRENLTGHALFLSNYVFLMQGEWGGSLSHFWTLAVEEQFYLFWPLLILFLPKRCLLPTIWVTIAVAPLYRLGMELWAPSVSLAELATPGSLDSLGIGALLAWWRRQEGPDRNGRWEWSSRKGMAVIVGGAGLTYGVLYGGRLAEILPEPLRALELTALSVLFGALVHSAARGFRGWRGWVLELSPVRYLGRISYGFYLVHNFAWWPTLATCSVLGIADAPFGVELALNLGWSLIAAALCWHLLEARVVRWKRLFPYLRSDLPVAVPRKTAAGSPRRGLPALISQWKAEGWPIGRLIRSRVSSRTDDRPRGSSQ